MTQRNIRATVGAIWAAVLLGIAAQSLAASAPEIRERSSPQETREVVPIWTEGLMPGMKRVRSLREMKAEGVTYQRLDFSCGPAALATLMQYHLGRPITEYEIIAGIAEEADLERVRARKGFSLLELARFAKRQGYEAWGYRMAWEDLLGLNEPVIVPINLKGYPHFVIFLGEKGGRVLLSDPAFGNTSMKTAKFQDVWTKGIVLHVRRPDDLPYPQAWSASLPLMPTDAETLQWASRPFFQQTIGRLQ